MKLLNFSTEYPDEAACIAKLRELREADEHVCPKCGHTKWYWKRDKLCYECKHCHHRESIRKGTVMEFSKLPFLYWFKAMHFLTATKDSFSALELQNQLGHRRYQPIWEMLHKLRSVMGKRDGIYMLFGNVEISESSFATVIPDKAEPNTTKCEKVGLPLTKVLVMAESEPVAVPKPGKKVRRVRYLKMRVVEDLKADTVKGVVEEALDQKVRLHSDPARTTVNFLNVLQTQIKLPVSTAASGKMLPWAYIAKTNAMTRLANLYHGIKAEFLQAYLNEFCYKFNRRDYGDERFDRLLFAASHYTSDFKHRIYNRNLT